LILILCQLKIHNQIKSLLSFRIKFTTLSIGIAQNTVFQEINLKKVRRISVLLHLHKRSVVVNLLSGCTLDFTVFIEGESHHRLVTIAVKLWVVRHPKSLVPRLPHTVLDLEVVVSYELKVLSFNVESLVINHAPNASFFLSTIEHNWVIFVQSHGNLPRLSNKSELLTWLQNLKPVGQIVRANFKDFEKIWFDLFRVQTDDPVSEHLALDTVNRLISTCLLNKCYKTNWK